MDDDDFEWYDVKAAENYANHGVTFEVAREAFNDPFAIDQIDDRYDYDEERWTLLGYARGRLLLVAYTIREHRIRLISARAAEPYESREYHEHNSHRQ